MWGNDLIIGACAVLYGFAASYWISNGILVIYFNRVWDKVNKLDKIITWLLPINSMFLYAAWASLASHINLTIVLSYFTSLNEADSGTIGLALITLMIFIYFVLEFTIGLPFLRYVYTVYPVVVWVCVGILARHWRNLEEDNRNKFFTLVLLVIVVPLFVAKVLLSIAYGRLFCTNRIGVRSDPVINLQK